MNATPASRAAIVTGAGSGIGAATARLLAERGMDVGITYRSNEAGARATARAIEAVGRRAAVAHLDLASPGDAEGVIAGLVGELGRLDGLVNNAASNPRASALEETVEGWERTLAVDLIGPWACARAAATHMISAGHAGRIVNISSVLAFAPLEEGGAYCAAKAGLEALTKVMALEWASQGITVNAVAPGHTATPMNYAPDELDGAVIERPVIPVGRAAEPVEIAGAIAYLLSDEARYVTGASLLVDGGLLLHSGPQALQRATGLPPESA
jgi:NAD(P)-dependent dehydrogenase (short-subunit alcohol dehydrogenase family)